MLELFDAPDASLVMGAREETNTPLQALYMLNHSFSSDQAKGFANRVIQQTPSERLRFAYVTALGRDPSKTELELGKQFLKRHQHLGDDKAMLAFCQALICSAEFITIH